MPSQESPPGGGASRCRFHAALSRCGLPDYRACGYELLDFSHGGVRYQCAVRVRVSGNKKRNLLLKLAPVQQYDFLVRCTQQVASLEAQAKGRSGNLRDEEGALRSEEHTSE